MNILKIAENTVKEHNMLKKGDRVLVGFSGGADSTALLYVMLALREKYALEITCAHINHGLRKTADRDMEFCRSVCEREGIQFFCLCKDIKKEAELARMGEEVYARNVRYNFFESLCYDKIATAHNKNDVAETMVFNFMRGASLGGLSGIPYVRNNIIRPLLDIKKSDIEAFCRENGYDFVTDETNFEPVYTRNKIRLDMIPKICREFNPAFVDVVAKNASIIREDADFLDYLAEKEFSGEIETEKLGHLPGPIKRRLLELFWKKCSGNDQNLAINYIDDILKLAEKNQTGKTIDLPDGFSAKIEYGRLKIEKRKEKIQYCYKIYPDRMLKIPEIGKTVIVRKTDNKPDIYLDEASELTVRNRRAGDVFYPDKMDGKKKLSDLFTDKKMTEEQRDKTPIILCREEIAAVGNMRFSKNFQDKTKTGYKIEIKEVQNAE